MVKIQIPLDHGSAFTLALLPGGSCDCEQPVFALRDHIKVCICMLINVHVEILEVLVLWALFFNT